MYITPSPWHLEKDVLRNAEHVFEMRKFFPKYKSDFDSFSIIGKNGIFVADCGCHRQSKTNGSLMVKAPELLKTLKYVMESACNPQAVKRAEELIESIEKGEYFETNM